LSGLAIRDALGYPSRTNRKNPLTRYPSRINRKYPLTPKTRGARPSLAPRQLYSFILWYMSCGLIWQASAAATFDIS
ncbi:MAG: hypothetical protein Q4P12_06990, partial [Bacteroidales bacterium]|nr:hypothetical protein [Bacteroidales bacterium]